MRGYAERPIGPVLGLRLPRPEEVKAAEDARRTVAIKNKFELSDNSIRGQAASDFQGFKKRAEDTNRTDIAPLPYKAAKFDGAGTLAISVDADGSVELFELHGARMPGKSFAISLAALKHGAVDVLDANQCRMLLHRAALSESQRREVCNRLAHLGTTPAFAASESDGPYTLESIRHLTAEECQRALNANNLNNRIRQALVNRIATLARARFSANLSNYTVQGRDATMRKLYEAEATPESMAAKKSWMYGSWDVADV